jgi:hypothetical protein
MWRDALWIAGLLKEEETLLTGWRVGAGGMAGNLSKGRSEARTGTNV